MASETKPTEYVNNKALLAEVIISKQNGKMSNQLAQMIMLLAQRISRKSKYARYTYREDMIAFATLNLVKSWNSFNPEKSDSPFSYYTSCVENSFLQFLNQERKHRDIRDAMLVESGFEPSYTYTEAQDDNPQKPAEYHPTYDLDQPPQETT